MRPNPSIKVYQIKDEPNFLRSPFYANMMKILKEQELKIVLFRNKMVKRAFSILLGISKEDLIK